MTGLGDLFSDKPRRGRGRPTKAEREARHQQAEIEDSLALLHDAAVQMASLEGTMSVINNRSDEELALIARKVGYDLWKSRSFLLDALKGIQDGGNG